VESGKDIYCQSGAKYCNSSVNAFGIATAVDSLLAVKQLVFGGELSFGELAEILKNNWSGNEALRLRALKKLPKYGVGNKEADLIAADIFKTLAEYINGRPNVKGGIYRLGTFSINWRWEFGEKTAATPDGRLSGEPVSQNLSPSLGADTAGATALIRSVSSQDMTLTPNGSVLDLDLHSSAVVGEDGLEAMYATLVTYMAQGGFAVHYNVLNADVLRAAMEKPEDYPNLQVRLCGWNVLFSNLSKAEQLEFVKRSSAEA
jgi:formate C-acetyltransferase